jgi:anti-sigma regulatory factor (Ser/Thr protein kinase)
VRDPVEVRASLTLAAVPQSAATARRFIADICNAAQLGEDTCATAALLVSELVTNAIRYGGSRAVLEAAVPGGRLRVSVKDDNPRLPVVGQHPDLTAESGRGLQLVSALADDWGVESLDAGGKAVWFTLSIDPAGSS